VSTKDAAEILALLRSEIAFGFFRRITLIRLDDGTVVAETEEWNRFGTSHRYTNALSGWRSVGVVWHSYP
jgi:hypothetical protein